MLGFHSISEQPISALEEAAAGGDITGTLSVTLGDVTISASGEVKTEGSLSRTLGDTTIAASGEIEVEGSLSQVLAGTTLAAAGEIKTEGSLARTLSDVTLLASGLVGDVIVGSLDVTLDSVILSASGEVSSPPVAEEAPSYHGGGRRRRPGDEIDPREVEAQWELLALRRKAQEERERDALVESEPTVAGAPSQEGTRAPVLPADASALVDERVRAFTEEQTRLSERSAAQLAEILGEAKRRADEEFMLMAAAVAVALEDED
jgi:hypothetical protein